jgi:hypothetical protein
VKKRMKTFWCLLSVVGSAALEAAGPINNKPSHDNETANPPAHHRPSLAPSMMRSEMVSLNFEILNSIRSIEYARSFFLFLPITRKSN